MHFHTIYDWFHVGFWIPGEDKVLFFRRQFMLSLHFQRFLLNNTTVQQNIHSISYQYQKSIIIFEIYSAFELDIALQQSVHDCIDFLQSFAHSLLLTLR